MGDLADAGGGRATLDRYFPTHEARLAALAAEACQELLARITECEGPEGETPPGHSTAVQPARPITQSTVNRGYGWLTSWSAAGSRCAAVHQGE
jgi:AcrR family transcriptional regulator